MRIIGIIPARGGSKGILRKNLQEIAGIPLVGRKIIQAKESACTEVWVSTDDQEIANVSLDYGAEVINRPKSLSTDESSTDEMLMHSIEQFQCDDQDILVLLQPTSPLLKLASVNVVINRLLQNSDLNSVITIKVGHPFMWKNEEKSLWDPDGHTRQHRPRRQDLGIGGWETGGCYAIRAKSLREQHVRYPSPTGTVNVTYLEAIDIDTDDDLEIVRQMPGPILEETLKGDTTR